MSDANKTLARQFIEQAFNQGDMAVIDRLVDSNWVNHDPGSPDFGRGPSAAKQNVTLYRNAFPDVTLKIEEQIAEGERVVTRWTGRGTNRGALGNMAPTGKQATVTGITIDRIAGGKIVESWTNWDTLGLMQQLGAVPKTG